MRSLEGPEHQCVNRMLLNFLQLKIWCDVEKHRKQMNHDFDPQVSKTKGNSMIPLLVSSKICKK